MMLTGIHACTCIITHAPHLSLHVHVHVYTHMYMLQYVIYPHPFPTRPCFRLLSPMTLRMQWWLANTRSSPSSTTRRLDTGHRCMLEVRTMYMYMYTCMHVRDYSIRRKAYIHVHIQRMLPTCTCTKWRDWKFPKENQ